MIDCEHGRCLGCKTFCCKLLVRLTKEEAERIYPNTPDKISLDHDIDTGYCEFLDSETHLCGIFDIRPYICRSYTCNGEKMLQVAIKEDFKTIADLSLKTVKAYIPLGTYKTIPAL